VANNFATSRPEVEVDLRSSAALILITTLLCAALSFAHAETANDLMGVASSRADVVSGGDALVWLRPPADSRWVVQLNGRDVTKSFRRSESAGPLALVTGLRIGKNLLEVHIAGGIRASTVLTNHPFSGPVFSGPHQQPFVCQTELNGLGSPVDRNCSAHTHLEYYYKPKDPVTVDGIESWEKALEVLDAKASGGLPPGFKLYDPEHPPIDVAQTTLSDGRRVPYIVRRETGVINRAIYDIRFLRVPGQPLPSPWARSGSEWNGRLLYEFSGGCAAGYRQGVLFGPASHEAVLALGYAVATSTLNISANNCNDVLAAETLSMVKEHFIKMYGLPEHTIGWGESGGAVQQYLIAQNYPGLLDGIIPYVSFPDWLSYAPESSDCALLLNAFAHSEINWTEKQKTAVSGFVTFKTCAATGGNYAIRPLPCNRVVPAGEVYDEADRPRGVRCDLFDNEVNVYGRDPKTGFAARPLDNVGVQYGLLAFNTGQISAEQFIELNERVGGYGSNGNIVTQRTMADSEAVRLAYQHGLVLSGRGGLSRVPIIDWRWYSDDQGDNHDSFHSFVTRERLIAANGSAANEVMLIDARANTSVQTLVHLTDPNPETSLFARRERELVVLMDHWLDNLVADKIPGDSLQKIARDKPPELKEGCWATDGERIAEPLSYQGHGRCNLLYPSGGNPRTAAGGPLTDDVIKCALKPIHPGDYRYPLSAAELARLADAFPTGVCDFGRPGVGQEEARYATWQFY
jgi:hypothetical protein